LGKHYANRVKTPVVSALGGTTGQANPKQSKLATWQEARAGKSENLRHAAGTGRFLFIVIIYYFVIMFI